MPGTRTAGTSSNLNEWSEGYAAQNFGPQCRRRDRPAFSPSTAISSPSASPSCSTGRITLDPTKDLSTDPTRRRLRRPGTRTASTTTRSSTASPRSGRGWPRAPKRSARSCPPTRQDAYYELVLYEVTATANLYAMRAAEFTNLLHASQGRATTNQLAAEAEARFAEDQAMTAYYNTSWPAGSGTAGTSSRTSTTATSPDTARTRPGSSRRSTTSPFPMSSSRPSSGSHSRWWRRWASRSMAPRAGGLTLRVAPSCRAFSPYQTAPRSTSTSSIGARWPSDTRSRPAEPWVKVDPELRPVHEQVRATVRIDWDRAPKGTNEVPIVVGGPAGQRSPSRRSSRTRMSPRSELTGFVEAERLRVHRRRELQPAS